MTVPAHSGSIAASIDIGTNSVRLLVADLSGHPPRKVFSNLEITGLGRSLDSTGLITADAAARTTAAVGRFAEQARELHAERITVFGTAALREAKNASDIREIIEKAAGRPIRVLTGTEEAAVTFRGVTLAFTPLSETLVLDIGGGSTEFIAGDATTPDSIQSRSLALGSVRQTERFLRTDPPAPEELAALHAETAALVKRGIGDLSPTRLIGVAGSVTQLAALDLALEKYDPERIHGYRLSLDTISRWRSTLEHLPLEKRRALPGMVPERAVTVIAGTVILEETLKATGLTEVTVSEYDSLWGALFLDE